MMQTRNLDLSRPKSSIAFHKAILELETLLSRRRYEVAVADLNGAPALVKTAPGLHHPVGNTGITSTIDTGRTNG